MGSSRNNINVLTSDIVIGIGVGAGTTSEIALAIKTGKPILLLNWTESLKNYFNTLGNADMTFCNSLDELINHIRSF